MGVTTSSSKTSKQFINQLAKDYPQFKFELGNEDHWSPEQQTIRYSLNQNIQTSYYGVLHELAHALLGHQTYRSDFELLKLESQAWDMAAKIGKKYDITIDEDHIQNCLDTYRDWLHRRSTCPKCGTHVMQKDPASYHCYNCQTVWKVSSGRFVRPYRKVSQTKNA